MLTSLQVCFNAVAPLFLIMALGYGAKCLGAISVDAVPSLNKLAFRYFMPVMLFRNLYDSSLSHAVQPRLLLFLLGAFFRFSGLQRYRRDILLVSFVRLIVMPGILLTTAYLLGIRDTGFAGLISVFASATAIASFTMTQQMGGDSELAGDIVVATSALCIVTMFGWSLLFRQLGAF